MNQESFVKKILSGKKKYLLITVVILLLSTFFVLKKNNKNDTPFVTVQKGEVLQEVLISGSVKSSNFVDLAFEKTGSLQWIGKEVGQSVKKGEILAYVENGNERANLEDALAKLKSEEARYSELKTGSRPEEIKLKEIELNQQKQTLSNYYKSIPRVINDAYNKADSAINKYADPLFSNDQSQNPQLNFTANDQQAKNDAESFRLKAGLALKDIGVINDDLLQNEGAIIKSQDVVENYLEQTKNKLLVIQTFLIKSSFALNVSSNLSSSDISTYKDNISVARTNINTSVQTVSDLVDEIASQKILVEKSNQELEIGKIGATKEVLDQAQASIERAKANIKSAESALSKTIMRSPIDGIITKQDGKVGEIIQSGLKIISVMGKDNFEIETNIPEADLSKIKLGDKAEIILDAFGNDRTFNAEITEIDPAEKIVDGISTYKTTLRFIDPSTSEIRSGMTANVKITTARKDGVLVVPQKTVFSRENAKFVTVIKDKNSTEQREISIGLKGSNGNFEVLGGLEEGEKVSLTPAK